MLNTALLSVLVGLTGLSLIIAMIAIYLGIKAYVTLEAMKASTHKIEYVNPFADIDSSFQADVQKNQDKINKDYKEFNDELLREGSEFADYDSDLKAF